MDGIHVTRKPSISVFFPAYNDGGTIGSMVLIALATVRELTDEYEVVVVNDGSTDYTAAVLKELQRNHPSVKIIHHDQNRGYGATLITGFSNCTKETIFYTDGDAQYDVRELSLLFANLKEGVDWVNGYKISRSDPLHRKIIGRIYHWIASIFFRLNLRDVDCDFRLMRREMFDRVQLKSQDGVICVEMIKKFQDAGFHVVEVPVHHFFRAYGKSQFFNFRRILRIMVHLTRLWWELMIRKSHRR
ncbi:glycosyltransferase family 2 protein [bacterium]|nr:glycosyltransferase family 2 protein [bacterium]MCI0604555.1 glycosyltransferase family 2 protein [bacterium]